MDRQEERLNCVLKKKRGKTSKKVGLVALVSLVPARIEALARAKDNIQCYFIE